MAFTKILPADLTGKGVIGLPDTPGLSTTEMQEKFDEIANDVIVPKHNGLIDELALSSAAANIGALDVNNDASTVQAELNKLKQGGYTKAETDALLANKVDTQSGKGLSTNDFTDAYKDKLNGIEDNANNYTLPKGSQTTLGGVMGDGTTFTIDTNGVGHAVGGGGGGTSDYNALINKPKINNVEVIGDKSGSDFGFLSPVITITSDAGSTVKIKKGTTEIDAVPVTTTTWKAVPSDYGTWTVSSTLAGADEATGTVTVDSVKQYSVTVEHITATITATYPNDATYCTCSKGSTTYTATSNPQTFTVRATGTWTVETSLNGIVKSATTTITADGDSQSVTIEYADIEVTYDNNFKGKTITCTNGTLIYTKTAPSDANKVTFTIPNTGTWTVRSEVGGATYSDTVSVVAYTSYSATLALFNATITATFPSGASCVCNGVTATTSPYTFNLGATGTYSVVCTLDGISESTSVTITTDGQAETYTFEFGTINLTFDNEFRGLSLTCTDSISTITKNAPSTGNTMVFYPNATGTWTISGVYSGVTYTTTVTVSSLSTPVSAILQTIPNGKTITPTDSIQTWLKCAAINDKNYTTLAEVLNDTDTFTALLQDSNACDYMARSTTWAVQSGLVPTMTSDTTPSGTCSASSVYNDSASYAAYKAFDGNNTTGWHPKKEGTQQWVQYEFPNACVVNKLTFQNIGGSMSHQGNIKLRGSNDGSTFTDIDTFIDNGWNGSTYASSPVPFTFTNSTAYKYYRVEFNNTSEWNMNSGVDFQFYEADITTNPDAMRRVGMYDYCSDALLSNSTWCTAICNSTYFESILDVKVPVMTGNTTPSGECFGAGISNSYPAWKAFDGNDSTAAGWDSISPITPETVSIGYKFTSSCKIYKIYMKITGEYQRHYGVYCSNDGTTYTQNGDITKVSSPVEQEWVINPSASGTYWKLGMLSDSYQYTGSGGIATIQFYGRHEAQTNIIHSAASDTLYYIDGTSQTIGTTDTSGVGTVDWSNLPVGNLTIYSSVANDPDDLTSAYSKTVRITPHTTEVWLMPDDAVYWYGYESCEHTWNSQSVSVTLSFNTNNFSIYSVGTSYAGNITFDKTTDNNSLKMIYKMPTEYSTSDAQVLGIRNSYTADASSQLNSYERIILSSSTTSMTYDASSNQDKYVSIKIGRGTDFTCYALWLE